jgi:hypothetical protein
LSSPHQECGLVVILLSQVRELPARLPAIPWPVAWLAAI